MGDHWILSQRTWSTIVFMLVCEQAPISGALIIDVLARARVKLWGLELHESAKSCQHQTPSKPLPEWSQIFSWEDKRVFCSTNNRGLIAGYLSVFNYFQPTELNCTKLNVTSFRVGITFEVKKGLEPIFSTWFTHENVFFFTSCQSHIYYQAYSFFFLNVIHFLSKVNNSARSTNLWWTHRRTRVSFLARPEKSFPYWKFCSKCLHIGNLLLSKIQREYRYLASS